MTTDAPAADPTPPEEGAPPGLTPFEREIIEVFVGIARILGLPRSIGEIYGLLFASEAPCALDDVVARLAISKGSASQGLRQLRDFGAVKTVYVGGDRRDRFAAVRELRPLVVGFINDQLRPHIDRGTGRIDRITAIVREKGKSATPTEKLCLERLAKWHGLAKRFLPLAEKFARG